MIVPSDIELEGLIIGTVLMRKKLAPFEKSVSVVDFFSIPNQKIWGAILEADEENQPIEILDIVAKVNDPNIKGSTLSQMTFGLPYAEVRYDDVKRLKDLATLRRILHSFRDLAQMASDKAPVLDIIEENQALLDTLKNEQDAREGSSQTIVEVMENEVFPRLDKFVSGEMVKVPFGFEKLDAATNGGASLGELVVFGALPKSGKSSMMLQIARHIASQNLPTLIVSLEMLNYENGFRFLAQSSRFSVNVFRPDLQDWVADQLKAHAKEHYTIPLFFDQKSRTMKEVKQEVRRLKEQTGLTAAIIDYPQLMRGERKNASRVERIEEVFFDLKELAMKEEIVVYTPAQFNREGIKAERPTLAHFDGSSAIEKTANLGIFWTLETDHDPAVDGRKGKMWIELGRSVANDEFDGLVFHGKDARFSFNDR